MTSRMKLEASCTIHFCNFLESASVEDLKAVNHMFEQISGQFTVEEAARDLVEEYWGSRAEIRIIPRKAC